MKRFVFGTLAAWILAATPTAAHVLEGRGAPTCAAWNAERPKKSQRLEAWLLGYLSGLAQEADVDLPAEYTSEAIIGWVDKYCKASPSRNLMLAGFRLHNEIKTARDAREEAKAKAAPKATGRP